MTQMDEQEAKRGSEFAVSLLDSQMVQMLQDRFCLANNVYCVCLTRSEGVLTKAYGSGFMERMYRLISRQRQRSVFILPSAF